MPDLVLRTKKTYDEYVKFIKKGSLEKDGCRLCREIIIKEFKYWKIINCRFPWSRIADVHHMIIPQRHTVYEKLNKAEQKEFDLIKATYIHKNYDLIAEATNKKKTIPDHFHIHLIVLKK